MYGTPAPGSIGYSSGPGAIGCELCLPAIASCGLTTTVASHGYGGSWEPCRKGHAKSEAENGCRKHDSLCLERSIGPETGRMTF